MQDAGANPFAALSLIVAPAILTNASTVLTMSTGNRLDRAVDRARELARQLEDPNQAGTSEGPRRLHELAVNENRAVLLMRALRSFYMALAGFALATLMSLIGAVVAASANASSLVPALEIVAVAAGSAAVGALVHGATLLLRETRLAVAILHERSEQIRRRIEQGGRL